MVHCYQIFYPLMVSCRQNMRARGKLSFGVLCIWYGKRVITRFFSPKTWWLLIYFSRFSWLLSFGFHIDLKNLVLAGWIGAKAHVFRDLFWGQGPYGAWCDRFCCRLGFALMFVALLSWLVFGQVWAWKLVSTADPICLDIVYVVPIGLFCVVSLGFFMLLCFRGSHLVSGVQASLISLIREFGCLCL